MTAQPQAPTPTEPVGRAPRTRLYVALLAYVTTVLGFLSTWWDVSAFSDQWAPGGEVPVELAVGSVVIWAVPCLVGTVAVVWPPPSPVGRVAVVVLVAALATAFAPLVSSVATGGFATSGVAVTFVLALAAVVVGIVGLATGTIGRVGLASAVALGALAFAVSWMVLGVREAVSFGWFADAPSSEYVGSVEVGSDLMPDPNQRVGDRCSRVEDLALRAVRSSLPWPVTSSQDSGDIVDGYCRGPVLIVDAAYDEVVAELPDALDRAGYERSGEGGNETNTAFYVSVSGIPVEIWLMPIGAGSTSVTLTSGLS